MCEISMAGLTNITTKYEEVLKLEPTPYQSIIQEVKDLFAELEEERLKHTKKKIILNTIEECVEDKILLEEPLCKKISHIVLAAKIDRKIKLENSGENVLGVLKENAKTLTYEEADKLYKALCVQLDKKYAALQKDFKKITNRDLQEIAMESKKPDTLCLSEENQGEICLKKKLVQEQIQFAELLMEENKILEDLRKLRVSTVPQMCNEKIADIEAQLDLNFQKFKLFQAKSEVDIITETSQGLQAYKILVEDLKLQQDKCRMQIEDLKELKQKYAMVKCKEYDEILKSYIEYKTTVEKKKRLYKEIC